MHGLRHAGIYNVLGLLDDDDLPDYTTTDESDIEIDEVTETVTPYLLVSDVYTNS